MKNGHPIVGGISGLVFGLGAGLALLAFTVVSLSSVVLLIVPIAGLVLGIAWGVWAPLGAASRRLPAAPPDPEPAG